ncbi:MAG: hemin uptake protein HemP [Pseudomonadota bacterium]
MRAWAERRMQTKTPIEENSQGSPPVDRRTGPFDVSELMRGGREVILLHNGAEYLLRITSNERLILTKRGGSC